jgi:hypothetical protein
MKWLVLGATVAVGVLVAGCGNKGAGGGDMGVCDPMVYPCGPYGLAPGSVVADLTLQGRRDTNHDGSPLDNPIAPIAIGDYFRAHDTDVLFISLATVWCQPCASEQPQLKQLFTDYQTAGKRVAFLELILQDSAGAPAGMPIVDTWTSTYALPFDMAADPQNALAPFYNPTSFPVQLVLRVPTMTLTYQHTGVSTDLKAAIDAALAAP